MSGSMPSTKHLWGGALSPCLPCKNLNFLPSSLFLCALFCAFLLEVDVRFWTAIPDSHVRLAGAYDHTNGTTYIPVWASCSLIQVRFSCCTSTIKPRPPLRGLSRWGTFSSSDYHNILLDRWFNMLKTKQHSRGLGSHCDWMLQNNITD